jgi:hypothetical protein
MKYLLLLLLVLSSGLRAYVGEEILGQWGSIKAEAFIEFSSAHDIDYYEKNIFKGFFHYASSGDSYAHDGNFEFKGNKLKMYHKTLSNTGERKSSEFEARYEVKMSTLSSGLRYLELKALDKNGRNMGPLYFVTPSK